MIHFVLPIVIGLAPAGPPEIPIEVTVAVRGRGIVDASHLAEIRAKLARMVCPDDLPKVRVRIDGGNGVVAIARLPERRSSTYVMRRWIRLIASDWNRVARVPRPHPAPRRWDVERDINVLRAFDIYGTTVDVPLDPQMTYRETRTVLRAIGWGSIDFARSVESKKRPPIAHVCRITREDDGALHVHTREPTDRWGGDVYIGTMRSERFVITQRMRWSQD